jgi:hypothetical protein
MEGYYSRRTNRGESERNAGGDKVVNAYEANGGGDFSTDVSEKCHLNLLGKK